MVHIMTQKRQEKHSTHFNILLEDYFLRIKHLIPQAVLLSPKITLVFSFFKDSGRLFNMDAVMSTATKYCTIYLKPSELSFISSVAFMAENYRNRLDAHTNNV